MTTPASRHPEKPDGWTPFLPTKIEHCDWYSPLETRVPYSFMFRPGLTIENYQALSLSGQHQPSSTLWPLSSITTRIYIGTSSTSSLSSSRETSAISPASCLSSPCEQPRGKGRPVGLSVEPIDPCTLPALIRDHKGRRLSTLATQLPHYGPDEFFQMNAVSPFASAILCGLGLQLTDIYCGSPSLNESNLNKSLKSTPRGGSPRWL